MAAATAGGAAAPNADAAESGSGNEVKNPCGGAPGTGVTLPGYFKPTKYISNNNFSYPGTEELGSDEMRISFVGSCPWPPRRNQAAACMMVELSNGQSFFFDFGPGRLRNILAMGVPQATVNDIFIIHLHFDHFGELPYALPFTASVGRFKPLRVTGPSGRTPELGTRARVANMKKMLTWHLKGLDFGPIGDGSKLR